MCGSHSLRLIGDLSQAFIAVLFLSVVLGYLGAGPGLSKDLVHLVILVRNCAS